MLTKWGKALEPSNILPEYPRPQFQRQSYYSLKRRVGICVHPAGHADAAAPL